MGTNVTFFVVCDAPYFPGLVGLINSLRLMGHQEPIVVGDCGLTPTQRELLAGQCTLFPLDRRLVKSPMQFKPFARQLHPEGIVVIIDADMIVTKNLSPMIAAAASGKICVCPDTETKRWFAEWQEIFALSSAPRHQIYINSGFVVFSASHWPTLLERWWAACERIFSHATYQEGARSATSVGDQDALNAILMSEYPADAFSFLPYDQEVRPWLLKRVRIEDARVLRCKYQGEQPTILHSGLRPKLWQRAGVRRNAYSIFLRRLLSGPDVALSVPPQLLGPWLRPGLFGGFAYMGLSTLNFANWALKRLQVKGARMARKFSSRTALMTLSWALSFAVG